MRGMFADLRQALRDLSSAPGFTASAILTLALSIGANTAVFSLLNVMLLRPLPVRDPGSLIAVTSIDDQTSWPQRVWMEIRDRQIVDGAFAWFWTRFDTAGRGERQWVDGIAISSNAFDSLGLEPAIGRLFMPSDDAAVAGDAMAAVISYRFWQQRFGGNTDVLGTVISLNRESFTIVGVTPSGFSGLNIGLPFDVAILLRDPPPRSGAGEFGAFVTIMGRLTSGRTLENVQERLRAVQPQVRDATNPYTVAPYREEYLSSPFAVRATPGGESFLRRRYETPFKVIFGIVVVVLLVACGNIALLMLARTIRRRHELAVRVALGASRARLLRQSLVESGILSFTGASLALPLAGLCIDWVARSLSTQSYAVFVNAAPDWRVLAFTATAGTATAVIFGALPALRVMRADPVDAFRQRRAARGGSFGVGSSIIVLQVAVSMVLVVLAGLFVRTFTMLAAIDVGFEADRVLVVGVDAERSRIAAGDRAGLYDRVLAAAVATPGVESAALSLEMPGGNMTRTPWIDLEDGTRLPQGPKGVYEHRVTAAWFATLGTRIVAGRGFDEGDRSGRQAVAIVNESFVRRFFKAPLGRTIVERNTPDGPGQPLRIVGVVQDAMYRLLKEPPPPTLYRPMAQIAGPLRDSVNLSVRHSGRSSAALSRSLVEAVGRVDPDISVALRTLTDQVGAQYAQERLVAAVAAFFGVLALLLAAIGLYGVTTYTVSGRRLEVGIRLALGAAPASIASLICARVAGLVFTGILIGLVASTWSGRLVASMLYGVEPYDAITFGVASIIVIVTTVLAAAVPARRATQVDPAGLLRTE